MTEKKLEACLFAKQTHCDIPSWLSCIETSNECAFSKIRVKEPELMTLQEAYKKAGTQDVLKCNDYESRRDFIYSASIHFKYANSDQWQIIPEPKVLNGEDVYASNSHEILHDLEVEPEDFIKIWEVADKNGQLKQWLNHKPLRNTIQFFIDSPGCEDFKPVLREALKNLKPLKPE